MTNQDIEWIRNRAYELWQKEGSPDGKDTDHWIQAEQEFHALRSAAEQTRARTTKSLEITPDAVAQTDLRQPASVTGKRKRKTKEPQ